MRLSIIVPVYQVERTLSKCINSIIDQSFRDWQMILVNDASTDSSEELCEEFKRKDHRIQVVHLKHNSGLSEARNIGLDKARGEYVMFVDSDDFLGKDLLSQLMECLTIHPDYDILEFSFIKHYGSKQKKTIVFPNQEYSDMLTYWLETKAHQHCYAWNKIYRLELFNNVRFPQGRTFEDSFTIPQLLKHCYILSTSSIGMYYYCDNLLGITNTATVADLSDLLEAQLRILKRIEQKKTKRPLTKHQEKQYADYYADVLNIQLDVYDASGKLFVSRDEYPSLKENMPDKNQPSFPILPYNHTLKLKLLHLIGLKRLCQLHRVFHRKR